MARASIELYRKTIGIGHPVFIIAEAGSNHNGDLDTAIRLIDIAAEAQADAIKFQTFKARRLYPESAGTSDYLGSATPIFDIIEALEMPDNWLPTLAEHAHERDLAFISSVFHEEAVELLRPFVDAYKIASYELTHVPLLRAVGRAGKPVIFSTGAATLEEARSASDCLQAAGCRELIALQCTAAYPAPPERANVRIVETLARELGLLSGLSDHTRDPTAAPMAAAALGAVVIEKHFTLSNRLPGPDHAFAVEPDELARLVQAVRRVEAVLGSSEKTVESEEEELFAFARRSIFATRDIQSGEPFTQDNVDVLRNGKLGPGLAPVELDRVLRSVASHDLSTERPLQESDIALSRDA